ncbi:hypothetical protein A9G35_05470 [Gilliamella sp. Choc5-1]|uniref:NTF2 fold immunity protein n=1 Tax=Gilliamella sp. Choc5-1 TaxID=3120238 RepID=UPI00080DE78C|nr:NTF2 fold immunity protein [Gilliamella apicola]OCG46329.1 hypothetical protein A9G35_05470 [Gilliamella apicola]
MNIENAKNTLKEFIIAMNHWELHCYPIMTSGSSHEDDLQMTNELNIIFDKFCTKRERKYGRQVALSCGNPPAYSPDEEIIKIEELKGNKVVIYTQEYTGAECQFRYTLHYKNNEWRIDRKEMFDDDKWIKFTL